MNLEKIWNHTSHQQGKDQIKEDILESETEDDLPIIEETSDADLNVEQCGDSWVKFNSTNEVLEEVSKEDLYAWYSTAMTRRSREPLQEYSFINHFFEGVSYDETFAYGGKEKGYLLGFDKFGVFTPTHFAPKTLRGGYDLFNSLGESKNIPAILAITEDLADTLEKMPSWHKLEIDTNILSFFRGEIVKKEIFYNSHPEVKNLMMGLLLEYLNSSDKEDLLNKLNSD